MGALAFPACQVLRRLSYVGEGSVQLRGPFCEADRGQL